MSLLGSFALTETALLPSPDKMSDMASIASHPAAFVVRSGRLSRPLDKTADRLYLRATGDGWSLLTSDGQVLLRGLGRGARRQCLEFARELGVLVVFA